VRAAEETLTNLLLLELSLLRHTRLQVRAFSKREEATVGADWEMWLGGLDGTWFGMRLQAKAINGRLTEFADLHYRSPSATAFQSDLLIRTALGARPARMPMYLLYTYAPRGALNVWPCESYDRQSTQFGCSMVSAFQIRSLRVTGFKRSLGDLSRHMYPWQCLVCCSGFLDGNLPARARAYVLGTLIQADVDSEMLSAGRQVDRPDSVWRDDFERLAAVYQEAPLTTVPPSHVLQVAETGEGDVPDDLSAILIIREHERARRIPR
jgi:hypothetical protein